MSLRQRLLKKSAAALARPKQPQNIPAEHVTQPTAAAAPSRITHEANHSTVNSTQTLQQQIQNAHLYQIHPPAADALPPGTRNSRQLLDYLHAQTANTSLRTKAADYHYNTTGSSLQSSYFGCLLHTLAISRCYGVASPQINVNRRVLIANFKAGQDESTFEGMQRYVTNELLTAYQQASTQSSMHGAIEASPTDVQSTQTNQHASHRKLQPFRPTICINPQILRRSRTSSTNVPEGCLSIPHYLTYHLPRASAIEVEYTTVAGDRVQRTLSGLDARTFQHEYDHLNGRLFIDYLKADRHLKLYNTQTGQLSSLNAADR